ncbi:hypothetical protein RI054_10g52650 [Pseudoscourfieldia marina]
MEAQAASSSSSSSSRQYSRHRPQSLTALRRDYDYAVPLSKNTTKSKHLESEDASVGFRRFYVPSATAGASTRLMYADWKAPSSYRPGAWDPHVQAARKQKARERKAKFESLYRETTGANAPTLSGNDTKDAFGRRAVAKFGDEPRRRVAARPTPLRWGSAPAASAREATAISQPVPTADEENAWAADANLSLEKKLEMAAASLAAQRRGSTALEKSIAEERARAERLHRLLALSAGPLPPAVASAAAREGQQERSRGGARGARSSIARPLPQSTDDEENDKGEVEQPPSAEEELAALEAKAKANMLLTDEELERMRDLRGVANAEPPSAEEELAALEAKAKANMLLTDEELERMRDLRGAANAEPPSAEEELAALEAKAKANMLLTDEELERMRDLRGAANAEPPSAEEELAALEAKAKASMLLTDEELERMRDLRGVANAEPPSAEEELAALEAKAKANMLLTDEELERIRILRDKLRPPGPLDELEALERKLRRGMMLKKQEEARLKELRRYIPSHEEELTFLSSKEMRGMRLSEEESRRLKELSSRPLPPKKPAKAYSPWDETIDEEALQRFVRHARDATKAERSFSNGAREYVHRARYEAARSAMWSVRAS